MTMKVGLCKLCLKQKELCKESHIIPRFLYKFLTGENNELVYLDKNRAQSKYNSEYEGGILCPDCDSGLIGKLEYYASKFIHGELPNAGKARQERKDGRDLLIRENDPSYDYRRFKLFLLSILWRSSISSRPFFQRLKLSPEVEEDLRQKILKGDPGRPDEYTCFIHLPPLVSTPDGGLGFTTMYMPTMSPVLRELGELRMCEFVIEGVHYHFIITRPSNMNVEPSVDKTVLTVGLSTVEEQMEIIRIILDMMKNHPRKKKRP